uniref:Uncharacterized protein n=1 Tax=Anopheles dirus TaxID=7168 RepID=A0A182NSV8_9DIPT
MKVERVREYDPAADEILGPHNYLQVVMARGYHHSEECKNLADFIEKIYMWFSVSNSYSPKGKLDFKKSYIGKDNQKQALDDMFDLMLHTTVRGKSSMQTFQKSILM